MSRRREVVATVGGVLLCILAVTPFALAINRFDWGVGLLLVAPLFVWLLLRIGKRLERWARDVPDSALLDPDYPEED